MTGAANKDDYLDSMRSWKHRGISGATPRMASAAVA